MFVPIANTATTTYIHPFEAGLANLALDSSAIKDLTVKELEVVGFRKKRERNNSIKKYFKSQ